MTTQSPIFNIKNPIVYNPFISNAYGSTVDVFAESKHYTDTALTPIQAQQLVDEATIQNNATAIAASATSIAALQSVPAPVDYSGAIASIQSTSQTDEQNVHQLTNRADNNDTLISALFQAKADNAGSVYWLQQANTNQTQALQNETNRAQAAEAAISSAHADVDITLSGMILNVGSTRSKTAEVIIGSSTMVTQVPGVLVPNCIDFGSNVQNRLLCLYDPLTNGQPIRLTANASNHQFYGLGLQSEVMRYQIMDTSGAHVFYAATAAGASNTLMTIAGNGNVQINGGLSVLGTMMEANDAEAVMFTTWCFGSVRRATDSASRIRVHRKGNMITLQLWVFGSQYTIPYAGAAHVCATPIDALPAWARPTRSISFSVPVVVDAFIANNITAGMLLVNPTGLLSLRPLGTEWLNISGTSFDVSVSYLIG